MLPSFAVFCRRLMVVGLLSVAIALLSGCSAIAPRLAEAWLTVAPSAPTPAPDAIPTPVERFVLSPEVEQVVMTVRQVLMQQIQADFDDITLVSVEAVEWMDGCLGLGTPNEICMMAIVPGYRVVFEADGEQYSYRTNRDATSIRLEGAPMPQVGEVVVVWTSPAGEGVCNTLNVGLDGIAFGLCGDTLLPAHFANPERQADLAEFMATFAPFEAETDAGHIVFSGQGSQDASPAQQRMIAEWARLVQLEALGGRSGASWGLAFAWHREGGIAGFCDDLTVYVTGQVYASSCKGNTPMNLGQTRLDADQLEQLYTWIDTLDSFELEQTDPAVNDAMTIRFVFSGAGDEQAGEAEQQAILDFAATLFAGVGE